MNDKIYRRPTQLGGTPKKKKNEKRRKRNTFINFRVSPDEKERIEARVALSGMPKEKYIIASCLYQTILVKGNIRTFTEIKNRMEELAGKIDKNPRLEDLEPGRAETLKTILEIIDRRFAKEERYGSKKF